MTILWNIKVVSQQWYSFAVIRDRNKDVAVLKLSVPKGTSFSLRTRTRGTVQVWIGSRYSKYDGIRDT